MEVAYRVWIKLILLLFCVNKRPVVCISSGNVMDLAQMNMNMMRNGCPLLPCQSACIVKNVDTGCYECGATCRATGGAVMGSPNMQINGQFFGCIPNWAVCPPQCTILPNNRGCFHCQCSTTTSSPTGIRRISTPHISPIKPSSRSPKPIATTVLPSQGTLIMTANNVITNTSKNINRTLQTNTIKINLHKLQGAKSQDNPTKKISEFNIIDSSSHSLVSYTASDRNVTFFQEDKIGDLKYLNYPVVVVLIASVAGVLFISSIVFVMLWRRSAKILHKQMDELYFVKKAHRQDSQSRLTNDDMLDPVYAQVHPTPEPPPRGPTTLTSPSSDVFTKNMMCSGQTNLKKKCDSYSLNHDYLELI